ncbi:hypothetical protein MXB_988 [Myxobolus squamalis]|nr:hypothetical protein MXB_988 [Myxobolus squamalis]
MEVLKSDSGKLLYFEVVNILNKGPGASSSNSVKYATSSVTDYLDSCNCSEISEENLMNIMKILNQKKFTKNECYQFLNIRPKNMLEMQLILNLDKYFNSEEEIEEFLRSTQLFFNP